MEGRVSPPYGGERGGARLQQLGVVFGSDLLPWKARILLMLAMTVTLDPERVQEFFDR